MWHGGGLLKTRLSEPPHENNVSFTNKLKVLLENGNVDNFTEDDPYAFQDVESYPVVKKIVGNKMIFSEKAKTENHILSKESGQQQMLLPVTSRPPPPYTLKLSKNGVIKSSELNQKNHGSKLIDKIVVHSPKSYVNGEQLVSSPRAVHTNFLKTDQKAKLVTRPIGGGKPLNFGKSQMSKLAIAKIEKTIERKNSSAVKKKTANYFNKTGIIHRLPNVKSKRSESTKSFDSDSASIGSNSSSRVRKKSLLEESLTGAKPIEIDWEPPVQAATTTVYVTPREKLLKHESLQRIWAIRNKMKIVKRNYLNFGLLLGDPESEEVESENIVFQKHWFCLSNDYNAFSGHNRKRDTRLAQLKTELRHKLKQQQWRFHDDYRHKMTEFLVSTARSQPNFAAFLIRLDSVPLQFKKGSVRWLKAGEGKGQCVYKEAGDSRCSNPAVPCMSYCRYHISKNPNQLLFTACATPVSPSNKLCGDPVLDKGMQPALCAKHKKLELESRKPKTIVTENSVSKINVPGKRNRSSLGTNRAGRSRKRKRQAIKDTRDFETSHPGFVAVDRKVVENSLPSYPPNALILSRNDVDEAQDVEVGEEVLPLDSAELATLATQATKLLEEHDFNLLNQIPAEAFNDFFTEDKGEYEPTLQETEELERALEAVDKDVKSLEKLSQTQGILDLLDEQTIAQTLASLPEVVPVLYQNGFPGIGTFEQTLCSLQPDAITTLPIPPHADVLQS